ncbi:MAG TPA: STAS domain-containing protein [Acidimicrobiales bacterium]|nr:STAS domain-containing protein [Acidimicrobiales bacterium]
MAAQQQTRSLIEVAVEEPDGTLVIRLAGDLDATRASELCNWIASLATTGTEIVFDLADVESFDAACLSVLGEAWAEARRNGHRVALRSCPTPDLADDVARTRRGGARRRRRPAARRAAHAARDSRTSSSVAAPAAAPARGRANPPHRRRRAHARRRGAFVAYPFLVAVVLVSAAGVAWFAR